MSYDYLWGWETHRNRACQPNARQSTRAGTGKARAHEGHAQAQQPGQGTRKQVQGMRASITGKARASRAQGTRASRLCIDLQACAAGQTAREDTCKLTEGMQWRHPGNGTWRVAAAVACLFHGAGRHRNTNHEEW